MNHSDFVTLCICIVGSGAAVGTLLFFCMIELIEIKRYLEWFKRFHEDHYGSLKKSIDPFRKH